MPIYEDIRVALEYQQENADRTLIPDDVPIIIPTFNTPSYLKSMVGQLEKRGWTNIIICDNNSTFPPMIDLLEDLSNRYHVVKWKENLGPRVYTEDNDICSRLPKYFVVTDPDLVLNDKMPVNAMNKMRRVLDMYGVSKVGLAIDIDTPEERKRFFNAHQVDLWERNYWSRKMDRYAEKDDLYIAPVDTTFSLYNRDVFMKEINSIPVRMTCNTSALRIAGRFTCQHMGWWDKLPLEKDEYEFYKESTTHWSSTENEKRKLGYK